MLIQFFNIFFILGLDKKFRSNLCYYLFTDINDRPECLKYATARMFADDTTITNSHKSTARFLREVNLDMNNLQNWPLANQLSLNVLKTEYMYFASDNNLSYLGIFAIDPLKIDEQTITRVQSTKSLGVVFDQRLVCEKHVDSLCKRVSSGLAALKQARQYVKQVNNWERLHSVGQWG